MIAGLDKIVEKVTRQTNKLRTCFSGTDEVLSGIT